MIKDLIEKYSLTHLFPYGSRVYGTNRIDSDEDFIGIGPISVQHLDPDITIYSQTDWDKAVSDHEISVLECCYIPALYGNVSQPTIVLPILRKSISAKSSNSWVKAKKKFIVEQDYNPLIGIKSLFHSLRILNFGTQIAQHGKIISYTDANEYWKELCSKDPTDWTWPDLESQFKERYNKNCTAFRLLAPKENNGN